MTWPRRPRRDRAERAARSRGGGIFERLAHLVVRRPWWVIGVWLILVAVLSVSVPSLMKLASDRNQELLPANSAVMAATRDMTKAFNEPGIQNIALVVLTNENGLTKPDEDVYRNLVDRLHHDVRDVVMVQDFVSQPPLRDVMESKDHKAWFIPVGIAGELGSPESSAAYQRVVATVKDTVAGSGLDMHMTGLTATVSEREEIGLRDLRVIETATVAMVLVILLVVYRNIVTMLVPLVTISVTQAAATQVVAALAQMGLAISQQTLVFMSAMMIGAGVDYAVFLISRYHEYLRHGLESDQAVARALIAIGKVIAASAATVAVTFLGMSFTSLKVFSTTGPALAVSIAVAFLASITLLPAILTLTGRRGWVKPKRELTDRFWRRSGIHIVRHPVAHLVGSLLILVPLAACVLLLHTSYDARTALPASAESNVGMAAIERHFPASLTAPQYVFIQSPHDLRTTKALADLEQMAQRVAVLPDISAVRGVTRPTGVPLEQATLSYQAGEIGTKLADATAKITASTDARAALTGGADKLADSLATVRGQLTKTTGVLDNLSKTLAGMRSALPSSEDLKKVVGGDSLLPDMAQFNDALWLNDTTLETMKADPTCELDEKCAADRDRLQRMSDVLHKVLPTLDAANKALHSLGLSGSGGANGSGGLQNQLASLDQGAAALAEGSRKIADGVRTLDDQTKQLGEGLSHASAFLLAMKLNASDPGAAGFYVSPEILGNDRFKDLVKVFMSPDGHSARYLVESSLNPYDTKAMDQVKTILATARGAQVNTSLADASISMSGMTPYYSELRDYYNHDLEFIVLMTVVVVFMILVLLLRAVVAPLYLVGTVILSCLASLGIGVIVLQLIGGQSMSASTPGMAFIVLVAVGADYNMLLISRIRDESPHGIRSGVIRTVRSTGSVITSAGMIFAAPMFAMLFSSIGSMVQGGFIIGIGLLLDTLVVRTITVPALAVLVGKYNWWPSGRRKPRATDPVDPPRELQDA
ncbi:RND family transporter [Mycolicibacterium fluoranthenivorans]|uniref:RND family transporter n=1 Tax=Mycolicibacterium fluoranthenivorans TaxID=258505 RepID=A0A7G8PGQ9_9MYCO|nr:RND family transporter [Mycolicibacterium fluoranthenivorans]QNJ93525.1 RND family transporter [Mycolicibacterium fluoranthenivorans]